jgi:hypothetical protein
MVQKCCRILFYNFLGVISTFIIKKVDQKTNIIGEMELEYLSGFKLVELFNLKKLVKIYR